MKVPMKVQRFATVMRLPSEKAAEYRALHSAVWPAVLAAAVTDPCRRPLDTAAEGQWRAPAEEIFHLG
ncbi:L-rhamnose mutarotase [Streptomyces sp. NPDC058683]|uniref:L-rhamnose mutarotase n=1 Tax=Streptomyces sp. NPDC058683 TaxID=3346597 RepID=UPI00364E2D13